jgi:MFS family permease
MTNGKRGPLYTILSPRCWPVRATASRSSRSPWLVLQRNGSALDASIVAMAGTLPLLAATLIAGAAVDYLGRRRVSMISDALSALSVAAVPLLALTFGVHVINVAVLAALAALGAFFDPAGMTARETMLPEAATRAGWTLDHANSVYEAIFNLAYIVGPGIGGLLIATLGGVNTMWVTAAAFGLSILAIALLRLEGAGEPDREALPEGVWAGIVEGLKLRLEQQGAAGPGHRRPDGHGSVHAHGVGPLSRSTSPIATNRRQPGLGADGLERRAAWSARWAMRCCRSTRAGGP